MNKKNAILQHAYEVFSQHGFHATGVDTALAKSGISKRTLYKYFRTKEALIAALIGYYQEQIFTQVPAIMKAHSPHPIEQIICLFDMKQKEFAEGNFSGCLAINAKLEFAGKDMAIEGACSQFYLLLEAYVAQLCKQAKCKKSKLKARQIILLFEGAIVMGQIHKDPNVVEVAKRMVRKILA